MPKLRIGHGTCRDMGAFLDRLLAVCEPESRVISARQGKNTDGTLMGWWE